MLISNTEIMEKSANPILGSSGPPKETLIYGQRLDEPGPKAFQWR